MTSSFYSIRSNLDVPTYVPRKRQLAQCYLANSQAEEALECMKKAIQDADQQISALDHLVLLHVHVHMNDTLKGERA